jgi:hypothetical protein
MLKVLKNQVTEVKDAMKDNVETLHEREGNLEDLESRATELEEQTVSLLIKVRVVNQRKTHFLMETFGKTFQTKFLISIDFFLRKEVHIS